MNDERGMMNEEVASGQWPVASKRQISKSPNLQISKSDILHPFPPTRFFFPQVTEDDMPRVVWPNRQKTASACVKMADAVFRQLSGEEVAFARTKAAHKIVALTSPGVGDGKTDLLLALAPHLAQRITGGVLAVDADFRKPDLTARLNVPKGTSANQLPLIYPTNVNRLNVLPVFPGARSKKFDRSWIEELREGWPLTLLDMASLADAEAVSLACCCDGAYLVVRMGYTLRRAVARAARTIRRSGGRLLGCLAIR